jgi:hypothetical protein
MIMETHFCHFTKSSKLIPSLLPVLLLFDAAAATREIPFNHKLDKMAVYVNIRSRQQRVA